MLTLRRSVDRGHADHGWLKSHHSFSFANHYDPHNVGYGNLRVLNEDRIAPGSGFAAHGHRDMEIISYVLEGELAHKESVCCGEDRPAHSGVIRAGDVQRMSAGRGVMHSEFNPAPNDTTHFLQIWIEPSQRGIAPEYELKHFGPAQKRGRLCLVASPAGRDGAMRLHADAALYAGLFDAAEAADLPLDPARKAYVHVVRGRVEVNGRALAAGDAAMLQGEPGVTLSGAVGAEVLVFDLAA